MNLILFDAHEVARPLPRTDQRARHLRDILRRDGHSLFDCGLVNGARGKGRILREDADGLHLAFTWHETPPALPPVELLVGMPRPQTVKKILGEVTALGVARMTFFRAEKTEPSYAQSSVWTPAEIRRHVIAGAEQAFCTHLPEVTLVESLEAAIASVGEIRTRLALDNYEATTPLHLAEVSTLPAALAVGSERGWSPAERERLRAAGFTLAHLGTRVLRTETACTVGIALLKARLGILA